MMYPEDQMENRLNVVKIASMYIAVIMGAGFCSGRESWQFFGVFGRKGYLGAALAGLGFVVFALMFTYIAIRKKTDDLGMLISPWNNKYIVSVIGWTMAIIYYTIIIAMSAAGGSLIRQQFGIDKRLGGVFIVILVLFTVMGNYERMAGIFGKVTPVLLAVSFLTVFLVIASGNISQSGPVTGFKPGAMSPNWFISSIVFMAYNTLGMVTSSGSCALRAKSRRSAYAGAFAGAFILAVLMLLQLVALNKDMAFTDRLDLPLLAYAGLMYRPLGILYAVILYGSIYATASSTFYGFASWLPDGSYKPAFQIISALVGYLIGLNGFQFVVEYLYPPQGYIGILFLTLVVINFIKLFCEKQVKKTADL